MAQSSSRTLIEDSSHVPAEAVEDVGRRYRFEHLALPLVLEDLYFSKDDPGPGDRVPEFDLPIVGGGRFRSSDVARTGPTLLILGSATCPVTDNAAPGLTELYCGEDAEQLLEPPVPHAARPGLRQPRVGEVGVNRERSEKAMHLSMVAAQDGPNLGHSVYGQGPEKVLVLHDWMGDSANYEPMIPYLDPSVHTYARSRRWLQMAIRPTRIPGDSCGT